MTLTPVVALRTPDVDLTATALLAHVAALLAEAGNEVLVLDLIGSADLAALLGPGPASTTEPGQPQPRRPHLDVEVARPQDVDAAVLRSRAGRYDVVLVHTRTSDPLSDALCASLSARSLVVVPCRHTLIAGLPRWLAELGEAGWRVPLIGVVLIETPSRALGLRVRRSVRMEARLGPEIPTFLAQVRASPDTLWLSRELGLLAHELRSHPEVSALASPILDAITEAAADYRAVAAELVLRLSDAAPVTSAVVPHPGVK